MPIFNFTPSDVKKSVILDPDWYLFKVTKLTERTAGTDGSKLYFYTLVGVEGRAKDVPIDKMFGAKYPEYLLKFLQATTDAQFSEEENTPIELEAPIDQLVEGNVVHEEYQGITRNAIKEFRKPGSAGPLSSSR